MNKHQAKERIDKLKELINDYRYNYHVLDKSIMSEEAADSLKHELSLLENDYPDLVTADSPTQRVSGEVLQSFEAVEHKYRMLSLNDVFSRSELDAWLNRIMKASNNAKIEFFVDIKMDGLACSLIYEDGVLVNGLTRGNGYVGENVTSNIKTIDSIPLNLRSSSKLKLFLTGRTEVRGEIVMYKRDFDAINKDRQEHNQPLFANPRNLAAGTIRQLDSGLVAKRPLHFRAYDLIRDDLKQVPFNDQAYSILADLGLSVNPMATVFKTLDEVEMFAKDWENKRQQLAFNTDGLVIKVNDRLVFDALGIAGKAPRGAVAFKYAAEQATTKVKDIFISIGRTGTATPVAILEPVIIAGSRVQMATLHNEGEILRKDIRIGDSVIVHKAGDIIPEIVEPLVKLRDGSEKEFVMPANCPDCRAKLVKRKALEAVWRCPNNNCPSRTWKQIEHYASKEAVDIDGMGEKNIISLIDAKLIADPADLYSLQREQLLKLDRFADKSVDNLLASINSKQQPELSRFIYGLGIRHVGVQTAQDLASNFKTLDKLIDASSDDLLNIEGIGEVVAESIVEYFSETKNKQLLEKFKSNGVWPTSYSLVNNKLADQKFVISGSLNSMTRDEAAAHIRSLGGVFTTSVAKDTNYLVVGQDPGASKITKAHTYNIPIVDEDQFKLIIDVK